MKKKLIFSIFYYLSYSHLCVWTGRQRAKPADDF